MEFDQQTLFIIAVAVLAFLIPRYLPRLMAGVPFVDPAAIKAIMDQGRDIVILDVRTPSEFSGRLGHVPDAVNVPLSDLRIRLRDMEGGLAGCRDAQIYVMCRSDNRSPNAVRILKKAGFSNLHVVKGGMSAWGRAGLPVEGQG